ncbi:EpsG family protein [Vibrio sp. 10N.222.51.C12]|uniref:EpsG family protein n=1 Tax=Vibrio sp. 10N.222.51.C12 TaxID=3229622 RepID=UPI00354B1257
MIVYWFLLFIVILLSVLERKKCLTVGSIAELPVRWVFLFFFMTLVIGFRFEVGGDWGAYLRYFERMEGLSLSQALLLKDPGYQIINFVAYNLGGGIFLVNAICGALFCFGLMSFCTSQPRPMLALVTAIPYMVIVLGMGYTRQGCALGFGMIALNSLVHKSTFRFSMWIIVAALFHKSAVLMMPVAALLSSRSKMVSFAWIAIAILLAYFTVLEDSIDGFYTNYVEAEYQSQGAFVRVLMCFFPALIFICFRGAFDMKKRSKELWTWYSIYSFLMLVALFVTTASTAIDRVALYLLPIQLVVFSHLPEVLGSSNGNNTKWVIIICLYYILVQFIWLFFSANSSAWVPYQFAPFLLL